MFRNVAATYRPTGSSRHHFTPDASGLHFAFSAANNRSGEALPVRSRHE